MPNRDGLIAIDRRNFISGLWHGILPALGVSPTQPTIATSLPLPNGGYPKNISTEIHNYNSSSAVTNYIL
jgi:hypothetical protein